MKHKHAELMAQYAQDAMTTDKPWVLWQCRLSRSIDPSWVDCVGNPSWDYGFGYRRKPKQHTIVLNTEQLKEVIMACGHVGWENEDFAGGVAALRNALGEVK